MIFIWFGIAWRAFLRLLLPPLPTARPTRIDRNWPCKLCGHKGGTLRAVEVMQGQARRVAVRHTCDVCQGSYDYHPVTPDTATQVNVFVPAVSPVHDGLKLDGKRR